MKSSSTVTSFRKKGADVINIPGTRVSVQNAQLLTSTGSPTLDFFIGGGLAIGTICLIEEDHYSSYSNLLLKYFLAEGVVRNHSIFLASGESDPKLFLQELPAVKVVESTVSSKSTADELGDNLKIAWRYKNKPVEDGITVKSHNTGYDLTKTMPAEFLEKCSVSTWNPSDNFLSEQTEGLLKMPYSNLYKNIKNEIESKGFRTSSRTAKNVLRIGINSIASPLWHSASDEIQQINLVRFLYVLKALLRTSFAAAFITVPSFLLPNVILLNRMQQMCDTVIHLESFVGSDKKSNPLFKDFDGLLHIKKLPVLNTFMYPNVTPDLAFKLKKRGLLIERLHLPPDFEESTPEQQGAYSCSGGGHGSKLDF